VGCSAYRTGAVYIEYRIYRIYRIVKLLVMYSGTRSATSALELKVTLNAAAAGANFVTKNNIYELG